MALLDVYEKLNANLGSFDSDQLEMIRNTGIGIITNINAEKSKRVEAKEQAKAS